VLCKAAFPAACTSWLYPMFDLVLVFKRDARTDMLVERSVV